MKRLPVIAIFLFFSFFSSAHYNSTTLLETKPIDSTYFKNHGIFVTFSPFMASVSMDTDNKEYFAHFSGRLGVNLLTNKHYKIQVFGAHGFAVNGIETNEFGFMVGKMYKVKNSMFWEMNAGLSYFGRKYFFSFTNGNVRVDDTFGIPFEATIYSAMSPFGVGIGIAGNLNVNQPYIGLTLSMRFGNPLL